MTTSYDTEALLAVVEVLTEVGTNMVFQEVTETYNVSTGRVAESSETLHTILAAPPWGYDVELVGADGVKSTDMQTVIAGNASVTPTLGMKVTWRSTDYAVTKVMPLASGDDIAGYMIRLSR